MLDWFLGLFRSASAKPSSQPEEAQTAAPEPPPFLRRDAMLDTEQRVAAYVFSVATPAAMQAHVWHTATRKFFDSVLIDHFAGDKLAEVLGKRLAFLPLSAAGLEHPLLERLPRDNLVIEFDPPVGAEMDRERVLARLTGLRDGGFRLSCGQSLEHQGLAEALQLASFISLGGVLAVSVGWPAFFLFSVAAAIPGIWMIWWMRQAILGLSKSNS